MNIGFTGLGNMGAGIASNLLVWVQQNGHQLCVFDINQGKMQALAEQGARTANSIEELAQQSQLVFTSLPSNRDVELVSKQLLPNLPSNSVWFETSTNKLASWRELKTNAPSK